MLANFVIYSHEDQSIVKEWESTLSVQAEKRAGSFAVKSSYVVGPHALETCLSEDINLQALVLVTPLCAQTLSKIKALRPSLDLLVAMTETGQTTLDRELREQYGIKQLIGMNDQPAQQVVNAIAQCIENRAATPFADALTQYVKANRDSWHTPGHFGGSSLSHSEWANHFYDLVGPNVFALDLSVSVAELDSLHEPHSVIAQAKELAAEAFGAKHTYFATNGSSTANKVILQALAHPRDVLLVDRGSHKSVHHGIIMSGAQPVWLEPSCNHELGLMGPVPKQAIFDAIDANPNAKLIFLTSCTYDGLRYDMAPIVEKAHAHGIKVVVDEAWYAHGYFHPKLRPTALESGADYVTQSTHKVLSAFSQASMIHVNDPDFDAHRFQEFFNMHASTSPQYSMIASLDVARMQASMEGYGRLTQALRLAQQLRDAINNISGLRVLECDEIIADSLVSDGISFDPTKITIDLRACSLSGAQLQNRLLDNHAIQVEKYTEHTLSLLVTIGTTASKVERLIDALQQESRDASLVETIQPAYRLPPLPIPTSRFVRPRDALKLLAEDVPLKDDQGEVNSALVGRVVQDLIAPYPPGVPLLTPGEEINSEVLEWLARWLQSDDDAEIHGLNWINGKAYFRCCIMDEGNN